jgi:hypothetical protein
VKLSEKGVSAKGELERMREVAKGGQQLSEYAQRKRLGTSADNRGKLDEE